jgi:glycosyltransferase involved in cell wall biosynthesis
MKQARLSIAMCTFNGMPFLREQLDGFLTQTRQPDGLVVSDDGSRDGTRQHLQRFADRAPFPVRLFLNPSNLGVRKNFDRAIGLCHGDLIFLSDQDDVWLPEKLGCFVEKFSRHPEAGLVFSDAEMVDESLTSMGYRMWRTFGFTKADQAATASGRGFDVLIKHTFVAGATMAFRSIYKPLILPIPDQHWAHDAWISLLVSAVSQTAIVTEPMNLYRQTQVLGGTRKSPLRKYRDARQRVNAGFFLQMAKRYRTVRQRLIAHWTDPSNRPVIEAIDKRIQICQVRAKIRQQPLMRLPLVLKTLLQGDYHLVGHGWKTALLDLVV